MTLDRTSRIVKWAYLSQPPHELLPDRTSLCAIFWRCVLYTPAFLVSTVLVMVIASPVLVPAMTINWWAKRRDARGQSNPLRAIKARAAGSVLWQGAKAVKSRACPIVHIQ